MEGFPFTLTSGTPEEVCLPGESRARQEGQELPEHQVSGLHRACKGISRAGCSEYLASPQAGRAAFPGPHAQGQSWEGWH